MRWLALIAVLWSSAAAAQITGLTIDNSNSSGSVSNGTGQNVCTTTVSGTVYALGGNVGESRNQLNITATSPTSFTTRFVTDLCTDSGAAAAGGPPFLPTPAPTPAFGCVPGFNSQSLVADYTDNFYVTAPAGTRYRVTVAHSISGAVDVVNDGAGIASTGSHSQVAAVLAGAMLDQTGSINLTSGLPINQSTAGSYTISATNSVDFLGTGTGSPALEYVHVTSNATCFSPSNGWECGVRLGLPCTISTGPSLYGDTAITAGQYPGSPSRTQSTDGNFLTVTLAYCGDGIVQSDGRLDEQCDQGNTDPVSGNGQPNSCCAADCTWSGIDPCYDGNGNERCDYVPTPTPTSTPTRTPTVTATPTSTPFPCTAAADCAAHATPGYSYECCPAAGCPTQTPTPQL